MLAGPDSGQVMASGALLVPAKSGHMRTAQLQGAVKFRCISVGQFDVTICPVCGSSKRWKRHMYTYATGGPANIYVGCRTQVFLKLFLYH